METLASNISAGTIKCLLVTRHDKENFGKRPKKTQKTAWGIEGFPHAIRTHTVSCASRHCPKKEEKRKIPYERENIY